jgi:hypothetical protein
MRGVKRFSLATNAEGVCAEIMRKKSIEARLQETIARDRNARP